MKNAFLYDLAKSTAAVKKPSGTVQLAYEKVFPVVAGQNAAMALVVLKKGGIREPHWHPDAWEFDYCISGKARMSVVGPNNEWREFKVEPGLIVFNNSTKESSDDIGVSVSLGGTPNHVLAATFGVPDSVFEQIPKLHKEVIITSKGKRDR